MRSKTDEGDGGDDQGGTPRARGERPLLRAALRPNFSPQGRTTERTELMPSPAPDRRRAP